MKAVAIRGQASIVTSPATNYIETDSSASGTIGELDRSQTACIDMSGSPSNYPFSFFGARPASGSSSSTGTSGGTTGSAGTGTGGTGSTGTGTTATTTSLAETAAVGWLTLDGQGGFTLMEWALSNGSVQPVTASGSYAVGQNCNISLTFSQNANGGATGSSGGLPTASDGLLVGHTSGIIAVQPDSTAGDTVTGVVIDQ